MSSYPTVYSSSADLQRMENLVSSITPEKLQKLVESVVYQWKWSVQNHGAIVVEYDGPAGHLRIKVGP